MQYYRESFMLDKKWYMQLKVVGDKICVKKQS